MSAAKRCATKGMTWLARLTGLGTTVFLLLAWLLQMVWRPRIWESDILYLAYLGIALAGCIVSWWRQWLGGILLVMVSLALGSYLGLSSPWGIAVLVAWTPELGIPFFGAGVLFFLSWWLSREVTVPR
ncbi:MAG: hypothetical protein HY670_09375 [Chloroflexi bacterium]|nr:hypothetical protein [Chloroflexota bacterium]